MSFGIIKRISGELSCSNDGWQVRDAAFQELPKDNISLQTIIGNSAAAGNFTSGTF